MAAGFLSVPIIDDFGELACIAKAVYRRALALVNG